MLLHGLILASAGLVLAIVTVVLVRRKHLAMRFAMGWLGVALLALVAAPSLVIVEPTANALGLTVPGLLVAIATVFLVIVAFQLSIALSNLREQVRDLAESEAVLRADLGCPHCGHLSARSRQRETT